MSDNDQKIQAVNGGEADNVSVLDMCKCGRAPKRQSNSVKRPIQGNCHFCNAEANKKYQRRLKIQARAFQDIAARIRGI